MTTFALDADYNYVDDAAILTKDGCDEVAQNVRVCLSLIPGESCVFPNAGLDIFSPLMRNEQIASQIIQSKILGVDGVDALSGFTTSTGDNRQYNFNGQITVDGEFIEVGS